MLRTRFSQKNTDSLNTDSMVGLFVHTMRDQRAHEQGMIEREGGRYAFVRLFSWIDGSPLHLKIFSKRYLRSENCRLYSTAEQMDNAYQRECDRYLVSDIAEANAILQKAMTEIKHGRA